MIFVDPLDRDRHTSADKFTDLFYIVHCIDFGY
jgi:hypothetical protein